MEDSLSEKDGQRIMRYLPLFQIFSCMHQCLSVPENLSFANLVLVLDKHCDYVPIVCTFILFMVSIFRL